jgi:hypothetical protein
MHHGIPVGNNMDHSNNRGNHIQEETQEVIWRINMFAQVIKSDMLDTYPTKKYLFHRYKCVYRNPITGEERHLTCEKLPPILKVIRREIKEMSTIPHGNKVRAIILEEGIYEFTNDNIVCKIIIERW